LLPALTTSNQFPSADNVTAPCEPSQRQARAAGCDGRGRAERSVGARRNTSTAFPAGNLSRRKPHLLSRRRARFARPRRAH
jgi:hypothetical protein